MKGHISRLSAVLAVAALISQSRAEKVLVDFGDDGAYRSISVSSPDVNGNYWNGIGSTNSVSNLVNTANAATAIDIYFTSIYGVDSYNGPAGVTATNTIATDVLNTTFNAALLGDLGITNAVFDYISDTATTNGTRSNVVFRIADLDPSKYYELTFFGSKKYPSAGSPGNDVDECSARYTATGGNGTESVDLHLGVFSTHNPGALAALVMAPSASNDIVVVMSGVVANSRPALNAMSIDVLDAAPAEPASQVMLVDFGSDGMNRTLSVNSPDYNGNAWNQVTYQPVGNIVDKENRLTTLDLVMTTAFGVDSYNGPAGATSSATLLTDVLNTQIDTAALGDLGVTNAAFDYFAATPGPAKFELRNCDPTKLYNLTFFGSHKYPNVEYSIYAVTDSGGGILASNTLFVGTGADHNQNTVVTISNVTGDVSNKIYVQFTGLGGNGYLNAMKIEMFDAPVTNTGYAAWAETYGLVKDENGDDDDDGLINIKEYGLGGNPTNYTVAPAVLPVFTISGSGATYVHVQRNDNPDLVYAVELATDLAAADWVGTGYTSATNVSGGTFDTVTNAMPSTESVKFIRLNISEL